MGTTIDAVRLLMTSMLSTDPWLRDPNVVKMPWSSEVEATTLARAKADGSAKDVPLKIGIYWTDGVVTPHPPIQRGLRILYTLIQDLKHKVMCSRIFDANVVVDKGIIVPLPGRRLGATFTNNCQKHT
ncbi:MAG: hypothetical protein Q9180_004298, partial [Flavoplaca navasiana]